MAEGQHTGGVRVCTWCNEVKPADLVHFSPHKGGKFGLNPRCRPCKKAIDAKRRNRPDQKARQKAWRDANKEKVREANRAYRAAGYKSTEAVARWRAANLERARSRDAAAMRRRRANDPTFALLCRLRGRLRTMVREKAGRRTEELFGYTMIELKEHLERQFVKGMSWKNVSDWEVDHIIPVTAFEIQAVDSPDFRRCWALSNLRPLWKLENRSKGSKVLTLL